jgi:hypothetical protein
MSPICVLYVRRYAVGRTSKDSVPDGIMRFNKQCYGHFRQGEIMDFDKMKDGLKDQMSEKVQEGLTKKLDEVKIDVKARFGDFGGQPGEKAISPSTSAEPTVNPSESEPTPAESESGVDETADAPIAVGETEADQDSGDAGKEEAA